MFRLLVVAALCFAAMGAWSRSVTPADRTGAVRAAEAASQEISPAPTPPPAPAAGGLRNPMSYTVGEVLQASLRLAGKALEMGGAVLSQAMATPTAPDSTGTTPRGPASSSQ